ncbi:MAG: thiamine pyrophosphate-binding protein [Acidobacteria bacterium]|nr:thiamine pyrophosphate-binding protein [Acidobacteriota bacterium]
MREWVKQYLDRELPRRKFFQQLIAVGFTAASAESVLRSFAPSAEAADITGSSISRRTVEGTGGDLLAEQLIASGVEYVFGNSGSGDAGFYDALVDRPQLKYLLVPHEGPLAAMAAGYAKASGKTSYLCVAGMVGMANFMGQLYNAYKDETNMVFVAYKREHTEDAGRGVHEEIFDQDLVTAPFTKWRWIARTSKSIPEVVRRAFKLSSTPPFGPIYLGWNYDTLLRKGVSAEIISQEGYNIPMRIRASQKDVEQAARMLLEAESPVMIAGDDLFRARAIGKAVELAELLGVPVTGTRSVFANFPRDHDLYLGGYAPNMRFPRKQDVVLNIGDRLNIGPGGMRRRPMIPSSARFVDMRVAPRWMADTLPVDIPLVADMNEGLNDLIEAVRSEMSSVHRAKIEARRQEIAGFANGLREARKVSLPRSPQWDSSPIWPARLTAELEALMEPDAYVLGGGGITFNPISGKTKIGGVGAHLGTTVGAAAGVKLALPNKQVVCLVGDGNFLFGPHALWTMARADIPVIVVVYNNKSYNGTADRAIGLSGNGGRMGTTGHMVHYYLGDPDINFVHLASGFGVSGEKIVAPEQIAGAWNRAVEATRNGKPYLIEAEVLRRGKWAENPWYPQISLASQRTRMV